MRRQFLGYAAIGGGVTGQAKVQLNSATPIFKSGHEGSKQAGTPNINGAVRILSA